MILIDFEGVIKGDAQQEGHTDWINLTSASLDVRREITTSGSGKDRDTSTPTFSEVVCTKESDISSNDLLAQATYGMKICEMAIVHFIQTGGGGADQVFMEYELYEPIISRHFPSTVAESGRLRSSRLASRRSFRSTPSSMLVVPRRRPPIRAMI